MTNQELLENMILNTQFMMPQSEKEKILLKILKSELEHNKVNVNIKSMYEKNNIDISRISRLDEIPFIPVNMFKEFDLSLCGQKDIVRVLNSSATTTGKPSKIYLDRRTSIRQSQALISTLRSFLGDKRRPMLVIDNGDINGKKSVLTARGAAIRGVSSFANKMTYVMDKCGEDLKINIEKLNAFQDKYGNSEILVYGFTYIIWSKFVKILKEKNIRLSFPKMKLLHSGGWKKLKSQMVSKEEFIKGTSEVFGTDPKNIIDFYGMVEQVGVVFLDCEYGYKHVPDFADIIIRDFNTLNEVKCGQSGMIEVMSALGSSYPSQAILTEDIGKLVGIDTCKCGRKGKYFKFKSRVEKAEIRGCGDTFAERVNKI